MNVGEWAALIAAAGSILGGGGWFVARATRDAARATAAATEAAARANAAPAQRAADLAVLKETVARVDGENKELRQWQRRTEALLRAFSWSSDRWCRQMERAGIDPEPAHPLVDEYNRTGV